MISKSESGQYHIDERRNWLFKCGNEKRPIDTSKFAYPRILGFKSQKHFVGIALLKAQEC